MQSDQPRSTHNTFLPILLLLAVALIGRLVPHPPNFTPLGAIALFGAAVFNSRWLAILLPFTVLYISDLVLNNLVYAEHFEGFAWSISLSTYLGFAVIIGLGFLLLRNQKIAPGRLALAAVGGSLLFYLITNFFSWYIDPFNLYPDNIAGLGASYLAALPFFFNSLLGNLFFVGVLFGAYQWYTNRAGVVVN